MDFPEIVAQTADKIAGGLPEDLREIFKNCYFSTLATTTIPLDDGTTFVVTGDIAAMWLRDSSAQVKHYLPLVSKDEQMARIIKGLIQRQVQYIGIDPYANAFNREPNGHGMKNDLTEQSPWVWERKYEIDSLCYPVMLAYQFWKESGKTEIFDASFRQALQRILDLWKTEQHHGEKSPYRFERRNCPETDTLANGGKGSPVVYTGMTWSGFRPSDDRCYYGYNIPSNMLTVVVLGYMEQIAEKIYSDEDFAQAAKRLKNEIDAGIQKFGIVEHGEFGKIYAYETDGMGHYLLMDDANVPNLLSIPYVGYRPVEDPIYQNTRRFALSGSNPFYYEGKYAKGLGSPHIPRKNIWPIGIIMQAITSTDSREVEELVQMLLRTDAGKQCMHESFNPDDPSDFTRAWFAWADSLFAELMIKLSNNHDAV